MSGKMVRRGRIAADNVGLLCAGRMVPAHDGTARGRAGGCGGVGLPELDAFFRKSIEMGRLHGGRFVDVVAFHILPAEIVRQNENDIGLRRALGGMQGAKENNKNEEDK